MAKRTGPTLPKALLPVAGRPFIDHKLGQLAAQGAERVLMLLGHGAEALADHVGDGRRYGLKVEALLDGEVLLGTGGAVRRAIPQLGEVFWVTYGDTLLTVPMVEVEELFRSSRKSAMMTVLHNRDEWDSSNVAFKGGLVTEYRKGAAAGTYEFIDYGMTLFTRQAFDQFPPGASFDLSDVLGALIASGDLGGFEVWERFYEIGSEPGYLETEAHLRTGPASPGDRGG